MPIRRESSVLTWTDAAFAARDGLNVRILDPSKVGWGIKTRAEAWETHIRRRLVTPSGGSGLNLSPSLKCGMVRIAWHETNGEHRGVVVPASGLKNLLGYDASRVRFPAVVRESARRNQFRFAAFGITIVFGDAVGVQRDQCVGRYRDNAFVDSISRTNAKREIAR